MHPRRRDIPGLLLGGALGMRALTRSARGAVEGAERRFLFVFAEGGWDPTWVFAPSFDNPVVDMPDDGSARWDQGDLSWVTHAERPSVDRFFRQWGSRAAIVNGLEVPSIAHERCRRLLLTGSAAAGVDDVPGLLAAGGPIRLPLGHVVFSGPSYQAASSSGVVRLGANGQLRELLDGSLTAGTSPALRLPADDLVSLEDAWVARRAAAAAAAAGPGAEARLTAAYARALGDIPAVEGLLPEPVLTGDDTLDQLNAAVSLFAAGASRCAMVADRAVDAGTWDHHSELSRQSPSYEAMFGRLVGLADALERTRAPSGGALIDEVTVVVCSEMGRFPSRNSSGGKDHWSATSMLLFGGGIRGGQVLGAFSDSFGGVPIDPASGELLTDGRGGAVIGPAAIGATLLHLAGIDPTEAFGPDVQPLTALIDA